MIRNIPLDLKAEALLDYVPRENRHVELRGSHKRNAYEDIAEIADDDGLLTIALSRDGLYDILPESMFHPIDRFDSIPLHEYKERFREECEQQRLEEENARKYFHLFDNFLIELSTAVHNCKTRDRYSAVIKDIICDRMPEIYITNRFVNRALQFMPLCGRIRGNKGLFSMMLRYILCEENLSISEHDVLKSVKDIKPRYMHALEEYGQETGIFLGDEFEERVIVYDIQLWKEDECDATFLNFISEMKVLEDYLNDFFIGLESRLRFNISTDSAAVRLADNVIYNYLGYNTNI